MQAAAVSNCFAHLGHQLFRDIHGEPSARTPAVERVVRVKFAGRAGRTIRSNTAASPQGERSDGHGPHPSARPGKPRSYMFWCLTPHARMLKYICTSGLSNTFWLPQGSCGAGRARSQSARGAR
jgi:hypothetical protein